MVAYFSGESSTGAAAIAPQRRDSPSITRRGVFLFLFLPSWQDQKICVTGSVFSTSFTFSHPRRKILHLEVQDPLYYPLQTVVRPRSILLSHITLCCPTVFLCFSQQYLSNCFNSIFRLLPDLRAPCQAIQEGSLLALPGPASYVAFMAASANVPEMQSRCGQQASPIYPMTHYPIVI